jgi:hypothetical protein
MSEVPQWVVSRLDEYLQMRPDPRHDELSLLETALFVEDAFGIQLLDPEIEATHLGSRDSLLQLIQTRRGTA